MAEKLPAEILTDIFTRFLLNSKSNNFKKLILLRRTCKKWDEIILKCLIDELSKQNHKSWEIMIGISKNDPYSKFLTYAAELHTFDRVNQIFNFNFPKQTISIKPEQDIKEFINNNDNQKEFSFKVSNDLKDENGCRLELLKVKAKVFWEKVYRVFDDKTFVEVGKSLSYVNVGDPYFDIHQDGYRN